MTWNFFEWARRLCARAPRGQFWFFFSASVFFSFGFSIFFFLFNIYLLSFHLNERSIGLISGLVAFGSILGTIPAGMCAERFGIRRTLVTGLLCTVIFSLLRIWFLAQPAQFALAILTGMTMCSWAVCLSPTVASLTREPERPFAFSLIFSSGIGVAAFGALVAGQLPGWFRLLPHALTAIQVTAVQASRLTLEFACGAAAVSIVPLLGLKLPEAAPRTRLSRLSNPFLRRFLPAMAVWALVTGSFPPFANVYFVHHLGLSLQKMGFVFSLAQLVQFLAVLCAPLLFRRTGLVRGVILTQIATAAALASLAWIHPGSHSAARAAWVYAAYMAVQYMNEPGIFSLLMEQIPLSQRSSASASTFFVTSACQAVASATVGAAIVRFGYSVVLLGIAGLAVMATVLFGRLSNPYATVPVASDQLENLTVFPR
jgi:Major Facilitator Superfamily